jgi:hypothetical protein
MRMEAVIQRQNIEIVRCVGVHTSASELLNRV